MTFGASCKARSFLITGSLLNGRRQSVPVGAGPHRTGVGKYHTRQCRVSAPKTQELVEQLLKLLSWTDTCLMLKFNAHLGFQFNELPFLQRIEAAAAAGFRAVEFPSPYEFDASLLADHLAQHNLPLIQFSAPAGLTKTSRPCMARKAIFAVACSRPPTMQRRWAVRTSTSCRALPLG